MACNNEIDVRVFVNDGSWPNHTLVQLYQWIQDDRTPAIFWRDGNPLTLNWFIRWLTEPGRVLLLPMLRTDPNVQMTLEQIVGMCWMDEIEPPHAEVHFWVRKKHWWHHRPEQAAWKILELIFAEAPALHLVVCRTNTSNRIGTKFIKRMGAHIVGEIPHWYQHGKTPHTALLSYITREDVERRQHYEHASAVD